MTKLLPVLIMIAVLTTTARATVVLPADLGVLARDARSIPRGRVVAVESRWTESRRGIETLVTLEAETYLKGALGPTVQFRVPGGQLGRFRSITVGAPQFAVGQRVIVVLGARGPSVPFVLGLGQGVFRLAESPAGWTVTPPPVLPPPARPARLARPAKIVRGDPQRVATPLAEFERRVRALAVVPR
jgi:hypothetical protein